MEENKNTTQAILPPEEEYKLLPALTDAPALDIANEIAHILDCKRGHDVKVVYVEDKTVLAEYFVLCTANSSTHIKSLIGEVEYRMDLRSLPAHHVEGRDNGSWVIADYSCVIVHVFSREAREFYDLDKLYGDAPDARDGQMQQ